MERFNLELFLTKSIKTDEHGNWIIEGEASNENLDFDEQSVLQEALLKSKDYFLKNGVISYDHKHSRPDPDDPTWNPEKYIIGEPLDVYTKGEKTFVKAKLFKTNSIAQEIVNKLKAGATTVRSSVGGRSPVIKKIYDSKLGRTVEKIVSVLWDELAITYKPVNQSIEPWALSSVAFVKSLSAGYETDSANMTGGQSLIPQDLENDAVSGLVVALAYGDIASKEDALTYLEQCGYTQDDASVILQNVVSNKNLFRGEFSMDPELAKSFDDAMGELEKLQKSSPTAKDNKNGEGENQEGTATQTKNNDDGEGDGTKDGDGVQKSLPSEDFVDVSPEIAIMSKSITSLTKIVEVMGKSIKQSTETQAAMEKSIAKLTETQTAMGKVAVATGNMVKGLSDSPVPRQGAVNRMERSFTGNDGAKKTLTRDEIMTKSLKACTDGKITPTEFSVIEDRLNAGTPISDEAMRVISTY